MRNTGIALRRVPASRAPAATAAIAAYLRRGVRLFRRAPDEAVRGLAARMSLRRYARGEHVCRTGDPAREIWVVRSGRLRVEQRGWTGQALSLEFMLPGDVSGMAALGCLTYPGEVVATEPTELLVLPVEAMRSALERWPELARDVLYLYCQRIHYIETLLSLAREPVEKRLIAALLFLYGKFGRSLPLTCAEIGASAGTTPETTMRVFKGFERHGWLERSRGRVEIAELGALKERLGVEIARA
jgi:CRP-like cAMP-binding protein